MFTKAATVLTCEAVRRRVIVGFYPHAARGRVSRARWQLKQQVVSFPRCVFDSGWCSVRCPLTAALDSPRKKRVYKQLQSSGFTLSSKPSRLGFNLRCSNLLKTRQLRYYTLYKSLLDLFLGFLTN